MIMPILGKKLAPPAIAHSVTKGMVYKVPTHLLNIIKGLPKSIIEPVKIFYKRYLLNRKLPGIFLYSPDNVYALHFHAEQIPEFTSIMSLAEDGESLVIDYKILEEDIQSVITLHEKLDDHLRSLNCGKLEYWFNKEELIKEIRLMSKDGIHQSGTTRIAKSKEEGVVNYDLKVFDTDNLYVCSSSVFPTSGQANPTFYLGAFAVRLAKHLTENEKK
jgi:choline dehydrogenase-like flavoprotein